jgi:putative peptidoglycan lipid II flippase
MNLLRALATVSGMTLLSRVTGLIREFLIARSFGASALTDAFFVAFKIPNLLRRLFAEGAFSQAFVPILAEYKQQHGDAATQDLIDHVAGCLLAALLVVSAAGVALAGIIVYGLAPGFVKHPPQYQAAVDMLRITFPYITLISMVALAAGVLNTYRKFMVPAFAPVLLNLSFIACMLWLAPRLANPVMALAWAVPIGGVAQLALQWWALSRIGKVPRLRFNWRHAGVTRVLKQMGPAVFGVSVAQLSLIINGILASLLMAGSVSWLYYADRLMEFPTGMLGVALGTIILPSLAKHHGDKNTAEYSRLIDWGLRLACLLALPAAVGLALLATPLIATMYHYGKFTAADVGLTGHALVAYSVGLLGLIAVKVLAPGFYAQQDIKTPVRIAIITLVFSQGLSLLLMWGLPQGYQHAGLAFAIGMGACLNAWLLLRSLRKRGMYTPLPGWLGFFAKLGAALIAMAAVLWAVTPAASQWMAWQSAPWLRAGALGLVCAAGAATYAIMLLLLGFRPKDFKRTEV